MPPKRQDPSILFWKKVAVGAPDECWEWTGSRDRKSYGRWHWNGTRHGLAHRAAYMMANAIEIPSGVMVLHSCDNPPCCNPRHLWLGSARDNTDDMVAKGRQFIPPRVTHCPKGHEYSEANTTWVWQKQRTYLARRCKACQSEKYSAYHWRTRETRLEKMRERRLAKKEIMP